MQLNTIYNMDALALAQQICDNSVHCCITSPPYYGLRNYGVDGQIGLEETMYDYIDRLVGLFTEIKRVMRDDGTVWVNLGDSYSGSGRGSGGTGSASAKQVTHHGSYHQAIRTKDVLPPKSLMMIPARFAIAMQDAGWILRQEIVWSKANPMPESVKDRCTRSHEMVYMFAKCSTYYYDADAIAEPVKKELNAVDWQTRKAHGATGGAMNFGANQQQGKGISHDLGGQNGKVNKRTVWNINTQPTPEAHFATFPPKLIEPMILAGSPRDGIVYDPFMGSGTTALVARKLGRQYIGSELNLEYVAIAERRLAAP